MHFLRLTKAWSRHRHYEVEQIKQALPFRLVGHMDAVWEMAAWQGTFNPSLKTHLYIH